MTEMPKQSVASPFNYRNTQDSFPFQKLISFTAWVYCWFRPCLEGPVVRSTKVTVFILFKSLNRIKMWSLNPLPNFFSFLGGLKPLWSLWLVTEFVWTCPKRSWSSWPSMALSSHTSHTPSSLFCFHWMQKGVILKGCSAGMTLNHPGGKVIPLLPTCLRLPTESTERLQPQHEHHWWYSEVDGNTHHPSYFSGSKEKFSGLVKKQKEEVGCFWVC